MPASAPAFDEVFDFYRRSGFLYPGKLVALEPRLPAIEATWRALLAPGSDVFCFVARRRLEGERAVFKNTACAFAYAPGTWQMQHLVSAERGEYTGTLWVIARLVESLHQVGAHYTPISFRPNNPGVNRLFGAITEHLPDRLVSRSIVDYGLAPARPLDVPHDNGVTVLEGLDPTELYARLLHPVELASLRFDDPELAELDAAYGAAGLTRCRTEFTAVSDDRIVGACLLHHASEGINLSFLENAIEYVRVAPELSAPRRRDVWVALMGAAIEAVRRRRDYVVVALSPGDRDLAVAARLVAPNPKQYAVLTIARKDNGLLRGLECLEGYYRERFRAIAAGTRG